MSRFDAVIFDLDGVLVDTARFHFIAWKRLADQLGIPLTQEQNEALKGVSRRDSLEHILALGSVVLEEEEKQRWLDQKNQWYLEHIHQMDPEEMLPGARKFLTECAAADIKVGLGSASKNAPVILERLGITHHFDAIIDGNKTTRSKPDPQVFQLGGEAMEVLPEKIVVFEDAQAGIKAAKNAKMMAVGVGEPEILAQADAVIAGFADFSLADLEPLLANNLN